MVKVKKEFELPIELIEIEAAYGEETKISKTFSVKIVGFPNMSQYLR